MTEAAAKRTAGPIAKAATAILLLVALIILLSLGTWQVQRLAWKEKLLADIETRLGEQPVSLSEINHLIAAGSDVEYRPATVTGTFSHDRTQFFFSTYQGQTGYYAYTPMKLESGAWLFVNRGFVPYDLKSLENDWAQGPTGTVKVTGLVRNKLADKPSSLVPDNDTAANIYYWKDLDSMAAQAGLDGELLVPFFLDADATPNESRFPIGGVTRIDFPNNHLQYALTWYGLAAVLVIISTIYWLKARRR